MMQRSRTLYVAIYLLAVLALGVGYLLVSNKLEKHFAETLILRLDSNLARSGASISNWSETGKSEIAALAQDPAIEAATYALLASASDQISLQVAPAQQRLRRYFQYLQHQKHTSGYFVVAPNGVTLASAQDVDLGQPNMMLAQPTAFQRALSGQPVLSAVLKSQFPSLQSEDIRDSTTSFSAAPVRDSTGQVVALIGLRLQPREALFRLISFSEPDSDIQTYAFARTGALLSHSREVAVLRQKGLWREGEDHLLLEPSQMAGEEPRLIHPVRLALQGEMGNTLTPYANAAGLPSVAAWTFFDELGFGLITEMPRASAFRMAEFTQTMTFLAFAIGFVVATLLFAVMLGTGNTVEKSRRKLAAILAATQDVSFQVDGEGVIRNVNDVVASVFGVSVAEAVGQPVSRFLDLGSGRETQFTGDGLRSMMRALGDQVIRCTGLNADGSTLPVGIRIVPLSTTEGAADEFLIVVHDYSEIDQRETALREALELAESGSRTKSSFLSTISHELRSPLISVIAALELLGDRVSAEEDRNLLGSSQRSAQLLLGIIDDILDFSRMEAGKLKLSAQPVSLERILSDVTDVLRWQAANSDVTLIPYCQPGLPLVLADGLRLRQVLLNLSTNAIKFSAQMRHPGRVAMSLTTRAHRNGGLMVTLHVRDNGIGMSPETMDQIFQPFTQADGSIRRKYGGTGLGLAISDRLIKMMDGHISVISDPGEGTVFEVELPLHPVEASEAASASASTEGLLKGSRVLIWAEDPLVCQALQSYCHFAGAEVVRYDPARPEDGSAPDLMVVQPASAARIDALRGKYPTTPVLHILGHRRDALGEVPAGARLALDSLMPNEVIETLVQLRSTPVEAPAEVAQIPQTKVLLIEDDAMTREITLRMLRQLGISADAVVNGQEGLDLWRSGHYALLLSDCHMPIMDGFQMAAQIRSEESERNLPKTPIIAVSADLTMEVEQLCQECEIDEYVPKPLTPAKLKTILQSHVGSDRGRLDS